MNASLDLSAHDFEKVMNHPDDPEELHLFDFSEGYDPEHIRLKDWGIGKYNEKRRGMYLAPQYASVRNIHMGIDLWSDAGEPVFSFYHGTVAYMQDNDQEGDYGPTIVIRYRFDDLHLFALYGHLSRSSLSVVSVGDRVRRGQQIGSLGSGEVNGGWVPHLHFQLSLEDPGEADMPGVVAEEQHEEALKIYPDPRLVLGDLY